MQIWTFSTVSYEGITFLRDEELHLLLLMRVLRKPKFLSTLLNVCDGKTHLKPVFCSGSNFIPTTRDNPLIDTQEELSYTYPIKKAGSSIVFPPSSNIFTVLLY